MQLRTENRSEAARARSRAAGERVGAAGWGHLDGRLLLGLEAGSWWTTWSAN